MTFRAFGKLNFESCLSIQTQPKSFLSIQTFSQKRLVSIQTLPTSVYPDTKTSFSVYPGNKRKPLQSIRTLPRSDSPDTRKSFGVRPDNKTQQGFPLM